MGKKRIGSADAGTRNMLFNNGQDLLPTILLIFFLHQSDLIQTSQTLYFELYKLPSAAVANNYYLFTKFYTNQKCSYSAIKG